MNEASRNDASHGDPQFLNLQDAREIERMAGQLGLTEQELRDIVRLVGPSTRVVRQRVQAMREGT